MSICGRSGCPSCKKQLTPLELVPVLSYLVVRGRCTKCSTPIGLLYPAIEITSALLFVLAYWMHGATLAGALLALCVWLLLIISAIDYYTQTISDALNIPFLFFAITYAVAIHQFAAGGVVLGAGFFGALWLASKGRWVGSGDIILAAGIGALMGSWQRMLACLLLTYILGGMLVSLLLLLKKVQRGQHIAFGPLLAIGAMVTLLFKAKVDLFILLYLNM